MTIEDVVSDHLAGDAAIAALVGARVYQLMLPQKPTLPAVRVLLVSEPRGIHLRGPNGYCRARIQVDAFANEYDASHPDPYALVGELADAIDSAMTGQQFDNVGSPISVRVRSVERASRMPIYESEELRIVRMMQDFFVWWARA